MDRVTEELLRNLTELTAERLQLIEELYKIHYQDSGNLVEESRLKNVRLAI